MNSIFAIKYTTTIKNVYKNISGSQIWKPIIIKAEIAIIELIINCLMFCLNQKIKNLVKQR